MENGARSSFLGLSADLMAYSKLSAAVLAMMFVLVVVAVIAVWIRNLRLLMTSMIAHSVTVVLLAVALVWVIALSNGHWDAHFEGNYNTGGNVTCPMLDDGKCCGWQVQCPPGCPNRADTCNATIRTDIRDFSVRVIPIVATIVIFGLVATGLSCTSSRWVTANPQPATTTDYETLPQ